MIVPYLLNALNIKYTNISIKSYYEHHPFSNTLLAISDFLDHYKILNETFLTSDDKIGEFTLPFIAKINEPEGFVLVSDINDSNIKFIAENGSKEIVKRDAFLLNWSGIALVAKASEISGEPDYVSNRRKQVVGLFSYWIIRFMAISIPLTLMILRYVDFRNDVALLQSILSIVGSLLCGLLIYQGIDDSNSFLRKVCTYKGRSDCSEVTKSKGGTLFNIFNWSEIGFVFFTAIFLLLNVPGLTESSITFSAMLSLMALPYIIYSISYQWFILKKWCRLCLAIQVILLFQFLVQYSYLASIRNIAPGTIVLFAIFSAMVIAVLCLIIPMQRSAIASISLRKELSQLKKDRELFDSLLHKRQELSFNNSATGSIVFGAEHAKTVIKCVTNPSCGPCGTMFKKLDQWLDQKDNIRIEFIFWGNSDKYSFENKFIRHLIALYNEKGKDVCYNAFKSWYEMPRELKEWLSDSGEADSETASVEALLSAHTQFCNKNHIPHTPAIYIEDHLLPAVYDIEDLKWFYQ